MAKHNKIIGLGSKAPTFCPRCDSVELAGGGLEGYQCLECGFQWRTVREYAEEWEKHHKEQQEESADSDD